MGEAHPRSSMEGNWNSDVSWPVECLLNGMNTSESHHMMYNNGSSHNILPQFRHRFQAQPTQPQMHLSTTGLPLTSSINVSIPSHPMVEGSELNGASVTGDVSVQDGRHGMGQSLQLRENDVLDDTDDASDEEEDEDEVEDIHQDPLRLTQGRPQNSLAHSHQMEDALVCQQVPPMIPMPESHCHPKLSSNGIIRTNGAIGNHSLQAHAHQQQPPPPPPNMMPMFPQMDDFNSAADSMQHQSQTASNDASTGFSVYGKMYFEGRIVLHLKQGVLNDGISSNGGMNFSSCEEPDSQKASHFQGCAMCRLNHRRRADSHRHAIRGVLFTFEDCTIVELYPEQFNMIPSSHPNELNKSSDQGNKICLPNGHLMTPYLATTINIPHPHESHLAKQRVLQHHHQQMEAEQISVQQHQNAGRQQQPAVSPSQQQQQQSQVKSNANPNEEHSWWEEFQSEPEEEDELKETETEEELSNQGQEQPLHPPPSCMNHKLSSNRSSTGSLYNNNNEEDQDQQQQQQSDEEVPYVKYKCSICSDSFLSSAHLDSHICLNHSLNTSGTSSSSSLPHQQQSHSALELDLTSSSNNGRNNCAGSFEEDNNQSRTVQTPTLAEIENIAVAGNQNEIISSGGEDESCHNPQIDENVSVNQQLSPPTFFDSLKRNNVEKSSMKKCKYSCQLCTKKFRFKKNLKQHQKEFHEESEPVNNTDFYKNENNKESQIKSKKCPKSSYSSKTENKKKMKKERKRKNSDEEIDPTKKDIEDAKSKRKKFARKKTSSIQQEEPFSEEVYDYSNGLNNSDRCSNKSTEPIASVSKNSNRISAEAAAAVENLSSTSSQEDEYEDQNELQFTTVKQEKSKQRQSRKGQQQRKSRSTEIKLKRNSRSHKYGSHSKPVKCNICNRTFTDERRLESHKSSHQTEKSSQCEKCGKRFARRDKLIRHMFVHNEEKMFACEICEKRFSRKDKLTDHLKSHNTADETHHCPMCKKEFLRPDILKQHVKLHGMDDKHQCPECLRFVTGKDRLEKHMARHEEAKALGQTLLCPLCYKYFIQRQSLKAHVKKFHPDSNIVIDIPGQGLANTLSSVVPPPPLGNSNNLTEHLRTSSSMDFSKLSAGNSPTNNENDFSLAAVATTKSNENYSCRQCPKTFAKKMSLRKHQRKHQEEEEEDDQQEQQTSNNSDILRTPQGNELEEPTATTTSGILDNVIDSNNSPNSTALNHSNILLSLATQLASSSPLSSNSVSPPVEPSIESVSPTPTHTILPSAQHRSSTPTQCNSTQLDLNNLHQHHHHSQLANSVSAPPLPATHLPLSLAASVSVASSITQHSASNALLGINGQNTHQSLHTNPHHHHHHLLQHHHHTANGSSSANAGLSGHSSLSCSHGQIHPHLSQHLSMSPLQHMNVGMTPPQSMFYYSHYSYQ